MNIILERFPYRYVECGTLDNGFPDYRIQKADSWTKRFHDMYLCDNGMQLATAMEDFEYTKWLDPEGVPCYVRDDEDTDGL
jgi:sulfur transfer complex TusBCD TusB component (DsrH family)